MLGLWALYRRRTLLMPAWEATQLVLGLAIPPLLLPHVVGTRVADALLDTTASYARVLLILWVADPVAGVRQSRRRRRRVLQHRGRLSRLVLHRHVR